MKFVCDGVVLSDAAIIVSKACATRTVIPVYECIKITAKNDGITLVAHDGEITIEKKIKAEVFEEGEVCVNGKMFSDFISKIAMMSVCVAESDGGIKISYGENSSFMQTLPASEFPFIAGEVSADYFEVKESDLKKLIQSVVFCCATDDSRPILRGCLLEASGNTLQASALDGLRMATSSCEAVGGSGHIKIVCPARTLTEISRLLEGGEQTLKLYVEKNMLSVCVGDTVLKSRLYLGEFVRKENIFPTSFTSKVTLQKSVLIESLERALLLIRGDKYNLVLFDIKPNGINIAANSDMGNVSEFVEAELDGKEIKIAMNGKFLIDAMKALEEEEIVLSFNKETSPFTVTSTGISEYLIMPVRQGN
ncbi:MAG: DNA polymerase III subunit beta [Clostridia bacterium]|nr:DNA polymerase III subunit beta [Clostridia bacterium]